MGRHKVNIAPPSDLQIKRMQERLEGAESVEFAALNVGIPTKTLREWMKLGRLGKPEFVPFVDMIDKSTAMLAKNLLDVMMTAVREGNLSAIQWLYKVRIAPFETRALQKQFEMEDRIEDAEASVSIENEVSEADIAAAEARAMAALSAEEKH